MIEIAKTFNTSAENLTLVFTLSTLGSILGIISSFYYRNKFNNFSIIVVAYSLLAILTALLIYIRVLIGFFIIYFFVGYLSGLVIIITTNFLFEGPVANKERLYTIATGFFVLGSITFPVISSGIVKNGHNWRVIYYLLLLLILIALTSYITITRKQKRSFSKEPKLIFKGIFINKNKNIIFFLFLLSLMFYNMSEWTLSSWMPTYFRIENFVTIQGASYIISIFWISMIAGRVIISILTGRLKLEHIVLAMSFISVISLIALMFFSKKPGVIYIFTCLTGLGFSGIHPLIFASGSTLYEKGRESLSTILYLSSGLGITVYSYLAGIISKCCIFISVFMPIIFFLIIISLFLTLIIYKKKNPGTPKKDTGLPEDFIKAE